MDSCWQTGYPAKATQSSCSGFCFKADGNLKVPGANDQRFIVSDCIQQNTAETLGIGSNDYCKSGDDAKSFFRKVMSPQAVVVKTEQIGSNTVAITPYILPGSLDYVNYCKCDRDLCNSAVGVSFTSLSMILAVFTALAVKMLYWIMLFWKLDLFCRQDYMWSSMVENTANNLCKEAQPTMLVRRNPITLCNKTFFSASCVLCLFTLCGAEELPK